MVLGGLWHGASWNFIVWGALHGSYLSIHKIISNKFPGLRIHPFFKSRIGKIFSILITQYFIFLAWIPFRVHDFNDMIYSIEKYVFLDIQQEKFITTVANNELSLSLIILFICLNFISYMKPDLQKRISLLPLYIFTIFITVILLLVVFFYTGIPEEFIYFKF